MSMPLGLKFKDALSIVAIVVAATSAWFSRRSVRLANRIADRSIYVDGQKFLIEICKQLVTNPELWCIYDDEILQVKKLYKPDDGIQQSRLKAFAHLHLNMFEIVLTEIPKPGVGKKSNTSNIWYEYFQDTLSRSHMIRDVLDEPIAGKIWSRQLLSEYDIWRATHFANNENTSTDH